MEIELEVARNGLKVPIIKDKNEFFPLHSTYDPEKEAQRAAQALKPCQLIFFVGCGWGYLPHLLKSHSRCIILQPPQEAQFLHNHPSPYLQGLQEDILVIKEDWKRQLKERLIPFCYQNFRIVVNNGWEKFSPEWVKTIRQELETTLDELLNDVAMFKRFGRLWHRHFFRNIHHYENQTPCFKRVNEIFIVGASPTLEKNISRLRTLPPHSLLIATDTALPALTTYKIVPHYVVTIDSQLFTLNHFLQEIPTETILVADLTALPLLTKRFQKILFSAGAHPLCQLASNYLNLPPLNTAGGNVTVAAYSFAKLFQPQQIHLIAVDFTYPQGKTYSRGTWLPFQWQTTSTRFQTLDTQNEKILQRAPYTYDEKTKSYTPKLFQKYKEFLREEENKPHPSFFPKEENREAFERVYKNLPEICLAPLRCWEFYHTLNIHKE